MSCPIFCNTIWETASAGWVTMVWDQRARQTQHQLILAPTVEQAALSKGLEYLLVEVWHQGALSPHVALTPAT